MAERARLVLEGYEERHKDTKEALDELFTGIEKEERRKKEQAERGFDSFTFFVYKTLEDAGVENPEELSKKIKSIFIEYPNWQKSEKDLRESRNKVTIALYSAIDDLDKVTDTVNSLFDALLKSL